MAYIPSECSLEDYEEQIYSGYSLHRLYIKHGETIIGEEVTDYASPYSSNLSWKRRILKNGSKSFSLNNFVSQEIELTLHDYLINDLNEDIEIKLGTYIDKLGLWVDVPLGIYKIQDAPTNDKLKTVYKLRDKSVNFDFNYNAKELIDNSTHETSDGVKYATKLEILLDICSKANVNYTGDMEFIGYNDPIGIYDNTITGRVYVAYIAEQAGCIATIDRNGNLTFIKINNDLQQREISEDILESFEIGDSYKISKTIYESGTIYFENGTNDNDKFFINGSNPYVANQEQLDRIANSVNGFELDSFKTGKVLGNPTIDPYDLIVVNYDGKNYKTFAQYTLSFGGTFINQFETTIEHESKEINTTINGTATLKKYVKQEIDNVNATITTTVGRVDQLEEDVSSISDIPDYSTEIANNKQEVIDMFNNYYPNSKAQQLEERTQTLQTNTYTREQVDKIISGTDENGKRVEFLQTTSTTLSEDGMRYQKTGKDTETLINQSGMTVTNTSNNQEMLFAGYDENENKSVVRTENLEVRTYLIIGDKGRFEKTQRGVGFYTL